MEKCLLEKPDIETKSQLAELVKKNIENFVGDLTTENGNIFHVCCHLKIPLVVEVLYSVDELRNNFDNLDYNICTPTILALFYGMRRTAEFFLDNGADNKKLNEFLEAVMSKDERIKDLPRATFIAASIAKNLWGIS